MPGNPKEPPAGVPANILPAGAPVDVPSDEIGVSSDAPTSIDLQGARDVTPPDAPVAKLEPLDQAGVDLAKWVLRMISVFVLISIAWVWTSEFSFFSQFSELTKPSSSQAGAITNSPSKDVLELAIKARAEFRDFWLKVFQTVLLNVLLPVLTALLGYVFGSRR